MSLSTFKKRWIENWCEEVYRHLKDGTMCNNVIGFPSAETGGVNIQSLLKSSLPLQTDATKNPVNSIDNKMDTTFSVERNNLPDQLPSVKFGYSHFQDQRQKVERLVHGLPMVLSSSTTQLDKDFKADDGNIPFIVVRGEEPMKTRRDREDILSRSKVTSAPASLTAQRFAQELKKSSQDISGGVRVNFMTKDPDNKFRTVTSFSKSNVSRARRLLSKRNQASRKLDGQPYSPIENCWTMAEVTLT